MNRPSKEKGLEGNKYTGGDVASQQQYMRRLFLLSNDDSLQSQALLALSRVQFKLVESTTLEGILEQMDSRQLDLVLLDADTPGVELAPCLRELRQAIPEIPIIVITADNSVEMGKQIVQERVFFYTVKPVNLWELGTIVEAAWNSQESRSKRENWTVPAGAWTPQHPKGD